MRRWRLLMPSPSFTGKRIAAAIASVQMLFFVLNYYGFHLFAPYDKKVLVVSAFLAGICLLFFAPTVEEQREYRKKHPN